MKTLTVLLVLWAGPVWAEDGALTHGLLTAQMFVQGVDVSQSMYLLGRPGYREVNPLLKPFTGQPVAFGAVKLGIASVSSYWMLRHHEAHPRLVQIAAAIQTAILTSVVIHNERLRPR